MTLDEARAELGVGAEADVDGIRRAYLRLIKTRKPETDPEGFQRARQAFEIARAAGEMEALAMASVRERPAPPGAEAGADEPITPPPAVDPFLAYQNVWKAIPASADTRHRLKVACDAREALPRDRRAYWLVASSLAGRATDNDLAEALRAGWRMGWPEFLEVLLVRLPGRASRVEVDAALASPHLPLRLVGAAVVARWDAARAASLIVEVCAQSLAASRPSKVDDLPIERILQVVLVLHELGAVGEAARAHAALRRFFHDSGLELKLVEGPLGGIWTFAEELADLPPDFPRPLRAAFAVAARTGDLRGAFFDACFHVRHHGGEVRRWVKRLGTTAPNVVDTLRGAMAREAARKRGQRAFQISSLRYVLIWPVIVLLVRSVTSDSGCSSSDADRTRVATKAALSAPSLDPRLAMSLDAARDICRTGAARSGQPVCDEIGAAMRSMQDGDCPAAKQQVAAVKRRLSDGYVTEADTRLVTTLGLAVWQICPPRATGDPDASP